MSIKNFTRLHPLMSRIKERSLLTGLSSTKKTYHIALEVEREKIPFKVGDSIAVLPQNDPEEVGALLKKLGLRASEEIFVPKLNAPVAVGEFLTHQVNIHRVSSSCFQSASPKDSLLFPENKVGLTEFLDGHTLLDQVLGGRKFEPSHLATLGPLLPRFYSIANSCRVFPEEIHLLVAYVSYMANGRLRRGVGSHFLCAQAEPNVTPIPIYLQPSHRFTLPEDKNTSIILVGSGTGIAPYRAFLQERLATQSDGRNWLFFGERHRASDFYYEPFWKSLVSMGKLRVDTAFSRDSAKKVYVQHKIYEERKSLWNWLQEGAYFYICGDAKGLAKDVDAMLHRIAREEGSMTEENARAFVKQLRLDKRYLADVY